MPTLPDRAIKVLQVGVMLWFAPVVANAVDVAAPLRRRHRNRHRCDAGLVAVPIAGSPAHGKTAARISFLRVRTPEDKPIFPSSSPASGAFHLTETVIATSSPGHRSRPR